MMSKHAHDAERWYNKGYDLGELGKYEEAIKCYEKAIEIDPNYAKAWLGKAHALGELGKHEESIKCFDKTIEIDPNDADTWSIKGLVLSRLGKHEEAIECFARAHLLTKGFPLEQYLTPKPEEPARVEDLEVTTLFIEDAQNKWVRVALAQLNFSLEPNRAPKEFGYTLKKKQEVKRKIFKALEIANKNEVHIICFPELCIVEQWIEKAKTQYQNMIMVLGTYYRDGFNICPIIIGGQDYYIRKINPSPHFEKEVIKGRHMKRGKKILVFQTGCGKFAVLVCIDCKEEVHQILHNPDEKIKNVDFIIVPEYNTDVKLFHELGNQACQKDNFPYVLQVNASQVFGEKAGGTCVIGVEHRSALQRYKIENLKPDDNIEYKLIEAKGETMIIVDLDINRKGAPVPASDPKMRFVGNYDLA